MTDQLSEIRQDIKELIKQGAIHNELLRTHEARSLALQKMQEQQAREIDPIKDHVRFVSSFLKWTGGIAAAALSATVVQFVVRAIF